MGIDLNMIKEEEVNQDRDQGIEKIKECRREKDILILDPILDKVLIHFDSQKVYK